MMSDNKKVVIIGGGVAGLSTGCYLQMNGYTTEILEMGKSPGGVCTGWKRNGYTFDGCIQWLAGATPSAELHRLWQELHAFDSRDVITFDELKRIETSKGTLFTVYADLDRLAAEMKVLSPVDSAMIDSFIRDTKRLAKIRPPWKKPQELFTVLDWAKLLLRQLPSIVLLGKYKKISVGQYAQKFSDPLLREVFISIAGDDRIAMPFFMFVLSWFHRKLVGYPRGGSLAFAKAIEQRYLGLGGKIYYGARVATITVQNDVAAGVTLMDGSSFSADIVVSAADGNSSIFRMLSGDYVNKRIIDDYNDMELFPSIIQVSLGVAKRFSGPSHLTLSLDRPLAIDDKTQTERVDVMIYHFDPSLSPEGKTSLTVFLPAAYEYWLNLRNNHARKYLMEKERIATEVTGILEKRLGDIAAKIEVHDVATPATYIRYTNCWRGSYEGWLPTPGAFGKKLSKTLPGLKNFYMAGQWVEPGGGLPTVAISARHAAQLICRRDGKRFRTVV
jgi:phytoene dehydrogenase-like protein